MNVGIVSVLYSITPLMVACAEFVVYRHSLKRNYLIGMILMVVSAALLSLKSLITTEV